MRARTRLVGRNPIPSTDETLNPPELQTAPSSSTSIPIPSGASSSSGVKRTLSESIELPTFLGVSLAVV